MMGPWLLRRGQAAGKLQTAPRFIALSDDAYVKVLPTFTAFPSYFY